MRKRLCLMCALPLAALSTGALGQALGSSPATSSGSTGTGSSLGIRGPGIATVPNNSLAPLPGSVGDTTSLPGVNPATPGLNPATPGLVPSTPTPGLAVTPGALIELPPPSLAPSTPTPTTPAPSVDTFRTCPPGITFC
jgi:hypothetical protein